MDAPQGFGELLRRYRVAAGLSQEALAERSGLSPHGISDLERGARSHPYPATVHRLAEALALAGATP
jgi:transcriptional regulator with XRE-family HTH domain